MIQLMRDPRDNFAAIKAGVNSYYSRMGETNRKSLASFINRARIDLMTGFSLNKGKNSNWFYPLKFEDLTSKPMQTMGGLAKFCEIEFIESVLLSPTILGNDYHGNSHDKTILTGISDRNTQRWHERLDPTEVSIIEYFMKDVMESWGYLHRNFELEEKHLIAASKFYTWYNNEYFYSNSYS